MVRKAKRSDSRGCNACVAKKNGSAKFEWSTFARGAFSWLTNFVSALRIYEFIKSLIEQSCSSG